MENKNIIPAKDYHLSVRVHVFHLLFFSVKANITPIYLSH